MVSNVTDNQTILVFTPQVRYEKCDESWKPRRSEERLPERNIILTGHCGDNDSFLVRNPARQGFGFCVFGSKLSRTAPPSQSPHIKAADAGSFLLQCARIPNRWLRSRTGNWHIGVGNSLREKTLGVYGYGRIGSVVAGYTKAFGMNVLVWTRGTRLSGRGWTARPQRPHGGRGIAQSNFQ